MVGHQDPKNFMWCMYTHDYSHRATKFDMELMWERGKVILDDDPGFL